MLIEKSNVKIVLFIVGYLFIIFSVIPLIRNDNWVFRIFEYPRFQKLIITVIVFVAFVLQSGIHETADIVFVSMLSLNVCYLSYLVFPYTFMAKNQMKRIVKSNPENRISLLICNVFQDNKKTGKLLAQVDEYDPDLILLVEVDTYWDSQLTGLKNKYPYRLLNPLNNTYGMSLYSKLELNEESINYLIEDGIPSISTLVKLRNGTHIKLFGLHPEPPVPTENPRSTERDAEILLVAKEVEKLKVPVIVAGDLNDVAWSYTTELFLKVSGLLDPRRGRGFFSTFHVKYPLLRWPLDHVFCSRHFCLAELKRLPDMGSDHFPIFISLELSVDKAAEQAHEELTKTSRDEAVAEKKIHKVS